jgi:hypothetical protein
MGWMANMKVSQPQQDLTIGDQLLTEHDLARRQQRSVKTIRNDRWKGVGVPYLKLGNSVRYRLQDAQQYEEARLVRQPAGISKPPNPTNMRSSECRWKRPVTKSTEP